MIWEKKIGKWWLTLAIGKNARLQPMAEWEIDMLVPGRLFVNNSHAIVFKEN